MHFIVLYRIIIFQCTVQNHKKKKQYCLNSLLLSGVQLSLAHSNQIHFMRYKSHFFSHFISFSSIMFLPFNLVVSLFNKETYQSVRLLNRSFASFQNSMNYFTILSFLHKAVKTATYSHLHVPDIKSLHLWIYLYKVVI